MLSFDELIGRFAAHMLTAGGRSRATVASYQLDLEQFAELAGVESVSDFDRAHVISWLNAILRLELAPRSRARKLSAVRSLARWALEYGHISQNPVPREASAPRSLNLPHAISESEINAMLAASEGSDSRSLRDRAILETLYASGMRVSELCGLRLEDVHLGEGFAIVTGKGNRQRVVPLGQCAIDAISAWLEPARQELCPRAAGLAQVFLTRRGPISRESVFRVVQRHAKLAGIERPVGPHTFRHSCASHMLARGADLRLVQELLGHSALSTTQVYTYIEKSRLKSVYEQSHPLG